MSKYTTELRFLCESLTGRETSEGGDATREFIIPQARQHIFDFSYPIFDENYKPTLETKIIRHFYTREIAEETFGLWKLRLEDKLNVIMPYYNQLYESALIKFNPLIDVEYSVNHSGAKNDNETNVGQDSKKSSFEKSTGKSIDYSDTENKNTNDTLSSQTDKNNQETGYNLHSDTPEGGIDGIEVLEAEHSVYLSDATKNTNEAAATEKGSSIASGNESSDKRKTGTETDVGVGSNTDEKEYTHATERSVNDSYIDIIAGKRGIKSMSAMLNEFRKTFLNIDKMVIDELEPLFFMLW